MKANALHLNELSHAELMYIAALTPTQLVIFKHVLYTNSPAGAYKHLTGINKSSDLKTTTADEFS